MQSFSEINVLAHTQSSQPAFQDKNVTFYS